MKTSNNRSAKVLCTFLLIFCSGLSQAQNLLDMTGWTIGSGSSGIFTQYGGTSENVREWGTGPDGRGVLLWRSAPVGSNDDGGWTTQNINIDHSKMYRFTVWIKKTNSHDGFTYFGCNNALNLNGTVNNNPFFWVGDLPELNKWYLLVGYIHGSGDPSTVSYGGIYDGVNGYKAVDITDFRFAVGATTTNHRAYLYFDATVNDRQYFYGPKLEMVNGNEPTIASLLGTASSSGQGYFSGNVGIGTTDTQGYQLAVAGNMITESVNVKLRGAWPDFVFTKDYHLPSLEQTEQHIKEKGHLPGIPSAAEVQTNGVELGEMNKKLLQKIEELTLHLIEMKKDNEAQRQKFHSEIETLKSKIK